MKGKSHSQAPASRILSKWAPHGMKILRKIANRGRSLIEMTTRVEGISSKKEMDRRCTLWNEQLNEERELHRK